MNGRDTKKIFNSWLIRRGLAALLVIIIFAAPWCMIEPSTRAEAQAEDEWSEPVLLSTKTNSSWFPDIAVDGDGRIHVVYDTGDIPVSEGQVVPGIMYTVYQDDAWREPNDLHLGVQGNIFRPAIAVGPLGDIHLTHAQGMWYRRAAVDAAYSAASWYRHALDKGITYMSDVAVDGEGNVHVVYEKWIMLEEPITRTRGSDVIGLSDIFYRRSSDNGQTWTPPANLSETTYVGSHRVQLKIDAQDVIHVSWDEGWDRWSLYDEPRESVYIASVDGGLSWSEPTVVTEPARTNAQTAVASDNAGGVLLVWRATVIDNLFYAWSSDGGQTWTAPETVPGLYARSYNDTPFDAYEMATDSDGNIHLVAVGRTRLPENRADPVPLGVYHLVWDGASWSALDPVAIYAEEEGLPEYPRIFISEGNLLHTAWFVRDRLFSGGYYRVFYSRKRTAATYQTPVPVPTATVTPLPTATPLPPPTATPFPTVEPGSSRPPQGLYTENDEVGRLAVALSPLAVIVLMIAVARLKWKR